MAIDIYSQIKRLRDTCVYVCVWHCVCWGGEAGRVGFGMWVQRSESAPEATFDDKTNDCSSDISS